MCFYFARITCRFPVDTLSVSLNDLCPVPSFLSVCACTGISEGLLWQEANALQFPEFLAKVTRPLYQGHMQKGNFYLLCNFLS